MEFVAQNYQPDSGSRKKPEIPESIIEVDRTRMSQIMNRLLE
jgi:hypothetical protein